MAAVLVTLNFAAQAQISIIPKAGITLSNVALDDDLPDTESNLGFVAGVGLEIPLTDDRFFAIQPELLYIQKGAKEDILGEEVKNITNYLELPLLLKVNFGTEQIKAFANAGPSFAYWLGGKFKQGDNEVDIDFDDGNYNRLDIGLQFGAGVGIEAGPGAVTLEARYGIGLTDYTEDVDTKNRVIAVMLGYAIPFGN